MSSEKLLVIFSNLKDLRPSAYTIRIINVIIVVIVIIRISIVLFMGFFFFSF